MNINPKETYYEIIRERFCANYNELTRYQLADIKKAMELFVAFHEKYEMQSVESRLSWCCRFVKVTPSNYCETLSCFGYNVLTWGATQNETFLKLLEEFCTDKSLS